MQMEQEKSCCPCVPEKPVSPIVAALRIGDIAKLKEAVSADPEVSLDEVIDRKLFPLHLAGVTGSAEVATFLLEECKVSPNPRDLSGHTPLHYAANEGHLECAQVLLAHGADPNVKTEDDVVHLQFMQISLPGGMTPLHLAAKRNVHEIAHLLLSYGANLEALSNDGLTPFDLAKEGSETEQILAAYYAEVGKPVPTRKVIDEMTLSKECIKRVKQREKERERAQRDEIISKYERLHPELFEFDESFLVPEYAEAVRKARAGDSAALRSLVTEVIPGVWLFHLLKPEFREKLLAELDHYAATGLPLRRPNSMNNYGAVLNELGFAPMLSTLMKEYICPLVDLLFPQYGQGKLIDHHSFVVKYKLGEDTNLDEHTDDSEITVNACLGREFEGGMLHFRGVQGTPTAATEYHEYLHQPGLTLIHLGRHIHGVKNISSGERQNLILWCREHAR